VAISFGFAEDRAMLALEVDPGDGEPKFFEVTAERDGDRIADRDPGWQADVVIGPAGAGHDPTATFGQHTWAPRCYRLDGIGLISSSRAETASGNQEARNPDTKWHRPSPIECDMFEVCPRHRGLSTNEGLQVCCDRVRQDAGLAGSLRCVPPRLKPSPLPTCMMPRGLRPHAMIFQSGFRFDTDGLGFELFGRFQSCLPDP
jgi:hypothetical protein